MPATPRRSCSAGWSASTCRRCGWGTIPLEPGDAIVLATDGVAADYLVITGVRHRRQDLAERVLERHGKGTDDALAVVVRYLGPPAR